MMMLSKQQRGEKLTKVALLCMVSYLLFTSFMWWDTPDTTTYIFERTSLLFFILIAQSAGIVNSSIAIFPSWTCIITTGTCKKNVPVCLIILNIIWGIWFDTMLYQMSFVAIIHCCDNDSFLFVSSSPLLYNFFIPSVYYFLLYPYIFIRPVIVYCRSF